MTTKNQEVTNILKISTRGGFLLRRETSNNISITKVRDEIVLDVEKRDVKPLYFDELSAKLFLNSPEYRAGIFPVKCSAGTIEVLCGQDACRLYVEGTGTPISVLPPEPPIPPEGCPVPPCTPCPQQCEDGSCPPCDPPPPPCPCQGEAGGGLNPVGSVFPNCGNNPCGAGCPCPNGGCPPCTICPGNAALCPDGSCPPCEPPECDPAISNCCDAPGASPAVGSECCMPDSSGMCMTVTVIQWGSTCTGPTCPRGAVCGDDGECSPIYTDPNPDAGELICAGGECNCPCPGNDNPCNRASGSAECTTMQCGQTTRTFCNSGEDTSTYTNSEGGSIFLNGDTGIVDVTGVNFDGLPNYQDGPGVNQPDDPDYDPSRTSATCGESAGGAPCFCRCCVSPDPDDCGDTPPCGGCPDQIEQPPPIRSMCSGSGMQIIYRKICSGPPIDVCGNPDGDCPVGGGDCYAAPSIIISWFPNVSATANEDGSFEVTGSGNPIGGPGAAGACNCNPGHGTSDAEGSGDFDDYFDDGNPLDTPWPPNNIQDSCQ